MMRIGGALSCLLSWINAVILPMSEPSQAESISILSALLPFKTQPWAYWFAISLTHIVLLIGFLRCTQFSVVLRMSGGTTVWLTLQAIAALLGSLELLNVVAAELALLLPFRRGAIALGSLICCEIAVYSLEANRMAWITPGFKPTPWPLAVFILVLAVVTYHLIGYSLGFLAASQMRQAYDLARVNGELRATQCIAGETARLAERLRFSRELHDAVGHHLVAVSVNLQLAGKFATGEARPLIDQALTGTRVLLQDIREIAADLRDLKGFNLVESLELIAGSVPEPRVVISAGPEFDRIDALSGHTLFRCGQELLTNALKHAGAQSIRVTLRSELDAFVLVVADDGKGCASRRFGNGLTGISERAEALGGRLLVESEAGAGFRATVVLPQASLVAAPA
jgi:signal transduction histidine kinase